MAGFFFSVRRVLTGVLPKQARSAPGKSRKAGENRPRVASGE
jgi:hypothetical protein